MTFKHALRVGAAALALSATAANASTTINLVGINNITNANAALGFRVAAAYWESILTNNATINIGVNFSPLAPGVIGSTRSRSADISVANWSALVNATQSNSTLDQTVVLPRLNPLGGFSGLSTGVDATGNNNVNFVEVLDGSQTASRVLFSNTAVIKAIGGAVSNPNALDGSITFSSTFGFDFNPGDGVSAGTFDFIGVAIHELGHALGFVSGVDIFDLVSSPNGPLAGALGYNLNSTSIFTALDLFRYSAPGLIDLRVGGNPYFSIDGGRTALFGNSFSTGSFNGDGNQASHWLDASGANVCGPQQLGILDPTFCFGQTGIVTGLDLAAFDAIGWNLSADALNYRDTSTVKILRSFTGAAVPEPGTWGMMILGFGLIGGMMRRRKAALRVTYA